MVIPREPFDKLKVNPSINKKGACPERGKAESKGRRRDYTPAPQVTKVYLLGVLHDATVRKNTYRIATKHLEFAQVLKKGIVNLGAKAWIYKEGKERNLWIIEFSKTFLSTTNIRSKRDKIEFIRGFFDAEGGITHSPNVRFYLYFCQKDKKVLIRLKKYLLEFCIESGAIHNPSKRIDPDYWRFYIKARSYKDFARIISSNHPVKHKLLRKKI